ncbi:hypothetical protein [Arthrobacter rhizosphaerae]|uniref:hypothetical protein n=1 Tax=Arthrobacter rhizosphaerae TaxID=2855490 RepID=UPI001FF105CD|nr:hypothetical protein [Arthrobacter rhizosphaerae]
MVASAPSSGADSVPVGVPSKGSSKPVIGVGAGAGAFVTGAGAVVAGAGAGAGADEAGAGGFEDGAGGWSFKEVADDGGAAAVVAAAIPDRVGASRGMGRPPIPGKPLACRLTAAGAPASSGVSAGVPLIVPGNVTEIVGWGAAVLAVGRVSDVARVTFVGPVASCAELSLPKKGSSVAWLAAPTPSSTTNAPATIATLRPTMRTEAAFFRTSSGWELNMAAI